jgi:BMFP domain-containing protein YqiC
MSTNNDLKSTLKSLADNLATGNKSASEVASSLNLWLKEGGEALRVKIEDEVERSVSKMGFVKRGEFEALRQQVAELTSAGKVGTKKVKEGRIPKKPIKKKVKSDPGKKSDKKSEKKSNKESKKNSEKKTANQKSSKITKTKKVK